MAVSLMLKSEDGRIMGYVLLLGKRLLFRINGQGERASLVLLHEKGVLEEMAAVCDSQERDIEYTGREIADACVVIGESLYAAAGDAAKRAFEKREIKTRENRESEAKKNEILRKNGGGCYVLNNGEKERPHAPAIRPELQRRWPPPPCWPSARYQDGVWAEPDGDA